MTVCIKHRTAVSKDGGCLKCAKQRRRINAAGAAEARATLARLGVDVPISMREYRQYGNLLWRTA